MHVRATHYSLHGIETADDLILLVKKNPELAEGDLSALPCAEEMIFHPEKFSRLNALNTNLAKQYYMQIVTDFFAQDNPNITMLNRLSDCYEDVKFNNDERKDFLAQLKLFLGSSKCDRLMKMLSQRTVLALFRETAHAHFNDIVSAILHPHPFSIWRKPDITLIESTEISILRPRSTV